jgi:hypothetical protein
VNVIDSPAPDANGAPFFVTVHAALNESPASASTTATEAAIAPPSTPLEATEIVADGASLTEATFTLIVLVEQSGADNPLVTPLSQTSYEKLALPKKLGAGVYVTTPAFSETTPLVSAVDVTLETFSV